MSEILYRLKRKATGMLAQRQYLGSGPGGTDKISLVIYLDYEREFGNPLAKETAETGFRSILATLNRHGISATWNCVGLLADYYPETLHELVLSKHELASHTFHHLDLTTLTKKDVGVELLRCKERFRSQFNAQVIGLHPPRDRWSWQLPSVLERSGYRYLIMRDNAPQHWHAHYLRLPLGRKILCVPSVADDWGYVQDRLDADAMLRFWKERLAMLPPGSVAAIGFHPWVLGSDSTRLHSFAVLIENLVASDGFELVTAKDVVDWYEQ